MYFQRQIKKFPEYIIETFICIFCCVTKLQVQVHVDTNTDTKVYTSSSFIIWSILNHNIKSHDWRELTIFPLRIFHKDNLYFPWYSWYSFFFTGLYIWSKVRASLWRNMSHVLKTFENIWHRIPSRMGF